LLNSADDSLGDYQRQHAGAKAATTADVADCQPMLL